MIYHLFEYLSQLGVPGSRLMTYLSFRAILAGGLSALIALLAGGKIINWLRAHQIGETIRELGLEGQEQKKNTPTMGGVIIIVALLSTALLLCDLTNIYTILLIITTLWCGAIGFADDYIKVFKKNKDGMSPKGKLILQFLLGLLVGLTVWYSPSIVVREKASPATAGEQVTEAGPSMESAAGIRTSDDGVKSTKTTIPFIKSHEFDYGSISPLKGRWHWYSKWFIYVLMIVFIVLACSNGANLTDGMDGLSAGVSSIVGLVIGILAWLGGHIGNSSYLNIMYIPGSGEIMVFMAAFTGALVGFLWYNCYPASVFMGDTGSLTIGGIIGVSAILIRKELLLPLLCGIFLVEGGSVLMQRYWFKYTKKRYGQGRRIFKMSPLHHHFQKEGIPAAIQSPARALAENKIVVRFWIVGLALGAATLAILKIR